MALNWAQGPVSLPQLSMKLSHYYRQIQEDEIKRIAYASAYLKRRFR